MMKTTRRLSITLPNELVETIDAKVKSGAYGSVSEVVRDGVESLLTRDAAVELWLRDEVVTGHAEYIADPSRAVPAEAILNRIKARRAAARS
jgi:putative addiction module CopG family antidote